MGDFMEIKDLASACGWKLLAGPEAQTPVEGCYVGDLLSWVMARAQEGNVWITVMGNVNAIAVAVLTEVSAIVLAEDASLDEEAAQKANVQGVPVYGCPLPAYETALAVREQLPS